MVRCRSRQAGRESIEQSPSYQVGSASSRSEEQFQLVGLLCRETLISLAQEVYNPQRHPTLDHYRQPQMPSACWRHTSLSNSVESPMAKKEARESSPGLANRLQHNRTADFREAALCVEANTSVVNIIAILSGRRDPEPERHRHIFQIDRHAEPRCCTGRLRRR